LPWRERKRQGSRIRKILDRKTFTRNYILGMINGALFGFVDSAASPYLVLPLFVNALGGSNLLIGLLPAIANGSWYLPQFLISHRLQRLPRKIGVYANAAIVRAICWAVLIAATFLIATNNPALLLAIFFLLYTLYGLAAGFAGTPFMDIVAKTVPAERRGSYFGHRDLLGALAAIGAGGVVNYFLNPISAPAFPFNFGFLFLIVGVAVSIGLLAFSLTIEPVGIVPATHVTFRDQLRAARKIVREHHGYRRYLITRFVLAIADIATPFYAIYAIKVLQISAETIGLYIWIATAASLVTNFMWSRLSDRRGNRIVLIGAATGMIAMPVIALAFGFAIPGAYLGLPFGLMFIVSGTARTAANIAYPSYLLEIAPAPERALYIGFTNTMLGIATFIPVIGGTLLDWFGFRAVLILALIIALIAWWLAYGMIEPREMV
jgi:MFS family permease